MQKAWLIKKKRSSKKIALALVLSLIFVAFGYSQYIAITNISSTITDSQELGTVPLGYSYELQIGFENPSLLMLAAGDTEFTISAGGEKIGDGKLDPFYLSALGSGTAYGKYTVYENAKDANGVVKISGTTSYDLYVTILDIPFVYYPTGEQQSKFIR
ncbi:MAG: hypothetical protein K8823_89 [Cenarchaeum symbiont of Oopsacas minuta]|nr:hypothetical protein [Cenarchaeum symbiont of Oopsacas minuta]